MWLYSGSRLYLCLQIQQHAQTYFLACRHLSQFRQLHASPNHRVPVIRYLLYALFIDHIRGSCIHPAQSQRNVCYIERGYAAVPAVPATGVLTAPGSVSLLNKMLQGAMAVGAHGQHFQPMQMVQVSTSHGLYILSDTGPDSDYCFQFSAGYATKT